MTWRTLKRLLKMITTLANNSGRTYKRGPPCSLSYFGVGVGAVLGSFEFGDVDEVKLASCGLIWVWLSCI
jgi:hypothetical protein